MKKMNVGLKLFRQAAALLVLLSSALLGFAQQPTAESVRIDRLVALARLWAAAKYFHPYLPDHAKVDWDAALVKAISKVNAARDGKEYSAAVEDMLSELHDPVTRVLEAHEDAKAPVSPTAEKQPTFQTNSDGVLVVAMTNYSDFADIGGTVAKLRSLKKELPATHAIVFDLRPAAVPSDLDQAAASRSLDVSGLVQSLTAAPIDLPGERRRMHAGYVNEDSPSSSFPSSGFYARSGRSITPESGAKDIPVVFLIDSRAALPDFALALQASGKGAIVAEGSYDEAAVVGTRTADLTDGVRAQLRLGELVYNDGTTGFAPNVTVPVSSTPGGKNAAFQMALQLAKTGKFPPPSRARSVEGGTLVWDKPYDDMQYPATEYRVLAAIRLWAVINYFYPYKELMGENWNGILRQFIPRMEQSKDALDYNLAIAEMVTHIHDSHGFVISPVLRKHYGSARLPFRVRMIEGLPVITGFTNPDVAKNAGVEIGDVILKVDGQDAGQRIAERLKYTAYSTLPAGMFDAAEGSLLEGPKDSTAAVVVRDLHDQVRELSVPRKAEYTRKTVGDRSGDVLQVLPGNIGYADLDRLSVAQVDEMFEKFKDCAAIIFDNRGYPQGTAWQIAPRLTDKADVEAAIFKRPLAMSPDLPSATLEAASRVVDTSVQRLPHTDKWRYHGKTVMLIDERAISQAEHTGLMFEAANGTTFVGSPTMGANGTVMTLPLPGGIYVNFSGLGIWHADGRQLQRKGLQPEIEVRPTLAGIRAGKDEVLDRALEYLKQNLPKP
jgi:C-terminal processing protease CtpA/Prc